MSNTNQAATYSPLEEKLNIYSHFLGLVLSIVGLCLLLYKSINLWSAPHISAAAIFGTSMVVLYLASTLYHAATCPKRRSSLRVFDHISIFILIAGTYTPFALLALDSQLGTIVLVVVWSLAAVGITLKVFFTGRFKTLSTIVYLVMGWLIIFVANSLFASLSANAAFWLVTGGVCYTVGALLYGIKKLPLNHATFHLFVLFGTASHFISVYQFMLPVPAVN